MNNEYIYMPNEIFSDLREQKLGISHTAFAYTYYYYINYLYRYAKYFEEKKTQSDIKRALGYNINEKRLDYIIKKDGLLDSMGYTQTINDYPISYSFDDHGMITFRTVDDVKAEGNLGFLLSQRNYKIKFPVKSFYRTEESCTERVLDGTYYEMSKTHRIDYEKFEDIIMNESLGVIGFYIYAFLKHKSYIHGLYQCPYVILSNELQIGSNQTIAKYIRGLEKEGFISVKRRNSLRDKNTNQYIAN